MPTTTRRPETLAPVQTEPPAPDLDDRLALTHLAMDDRLATAAVAFEVNTAHIQTPVVDPVDFAPAPLPAVEPALAPSLSPSADLLRRAHARLQSSGWTTGHCRAQGAKCAYEAIRAEADTPGQAAEAAAVLLEAIRRQFPDALTVPNWNDAQTDPGTVLRMIDRAARDAQ